MSIGNRDKEKKGLAGYGAGRTRRELGKGYTKSTKEEA